MWSLLISEKFTVITQSTLYNKEVKSIRRMEKKGLREWRNWGKTETEDWKGKAVASETSAGDKRTVPSTRRGEVSGSPARIPSRLGEPGSLFSRYKFLQLRLVVVMLLTRTRRELLKRRTIGARIYPAASLSRASRATPFVTAANPPVTSHRVVVMRFFSSASFINPGMRTLFWVLWLRSYTQRISILNVCVICIPVEIPATVNLHCIYYSGISTLYVWKTK